MQQPAEELVQQGLLPAGGRVDQLAAADDRIILPNGSAATSILGDEAFPLVVADYIGLPDGQKPGSPQEALDIGGETRLRIEEHSSESTAGRIFERLPKSREHMAEMIRIGSALASSMRWDTVVKDSFLPGLKRICKQ